MSKNIQKKVIDIIGVELMPGEPTICLGNGEQGFECCCDECDYYLRCFPEFDPTKSKGGVSCAKKQPVGESLGAPEKREDIVYENGRSKPLPYEKYNN